MPTSPLSASRPLPSAAARKPERAPERSPVFCFSVAAAAEPGVMPRVLELFAKRNLVPLRWHSDRMAPAHGRETESLAIDIQVAELTSELGDYVARCLRQIPGVETVLTSEKRFG